MFSQIHFLKSSCSHDCHMLLKMQLFKFYNKEPNVWNFSLGLQSVATSRVLMCARLFVHLRYFLFSNSNMSISHVLLGCTCVFPAIVLLFGELKNAEYGPVIFPTVNLEQFLLKTQNNFNPIRGGIYSKVLERNLLNWARILQTGFRATKKWLKRIT